MIPETTGIVGGIGRLAKFSQANRTDGVFSASMSITTSK